MPADRNLYLPVLVGAKKNYRSNMVYQRDDDGDNISSKNPNYNELTAMYWAFKNLKDLDAIGLVHYRRYFLAHGSRKIENVLTFKEVEQLLRRNDVVVPKKRKYYIETNYSHYIHAHHKDPLIKTRNVIKSMYPEYVSSFDYVMKQRSAHMFNMFIMKQRFFEEYSSWLFGILNKLESEINISGYSFQEARVFGYISELLLDVWIEKNKIRYVEVPWKQLGKRHIWKKMISFIFRKIGIGSKKTHF